MIATVGLPANLFAQKKNIEGDILILLINFNLNNFVLNLLFS